MTNLERYIERQLGEITDERDAARADVERITAERDRLKFENTLLNSGLRDIEERIRTKTGPIREALKGLKDPVVVEAWKWAVYGSCIHAQILLGHPATPGEGGGAR